VRSRKTTPARAKEGTPSVARPCNQWRSDVDVRKGPGLNGPREGKVTDRVDQALPVRDDLVGVAGGAVELETEASRRIEDPWAVDEAEALEANVGEGIDGADANFDSHEFRDTAGRRLSCSSRRGDGGRRGLMQHAPDRVLTCAPVAVLRGIPGG